MSRFGLTPHPAANAVTAHEPVDLAVATKTGGITMMPRAAGGFYQVVRVAAIGNGMPSYRVLHGAILVGHQASYPTSEDCARLEQGARPAASGKSDPINYGYYGKWRSGPVRK